MKTLSEKLWFKPTLALLPLAIIVLTSCASTVVKNNAGKTLFRTQADVAHLELHTANGDSLVMDQVNHSNPTIAGGNAFATGNDSVAKGVVGGVTAAGNAGLFAKVLGAGAAIVPTKATPSNPPQQ